MALALAFVARKSLVTFSSPPSAPRTSLLMVLVLLAKLALVFGRLLVLATKHISGKNINRLSLSGVFVLLFHGLVPLGTPGIHFADT